MHRYAPICTTNGQLLKGKLTFLWGTITWSGMRGQNIQAKKVYSPALACLFSPLGFKEFCPDLNRVVDSKSAPICLFVCFLASQCDYLNRGT